MTTLDADRAVLHAACHRAGLDNPTPELVRSHATSVYLLNGEVVARIHRDPIDRTRGKTAARVAGWLIEQNFPATEPLATPVELDDVCVTFWRYYPQHNCPTPSAAHLGRMLRHLHQLPQPPVELPSYEPLTHLGRALSEARTALSTDDRSWLERRRTDLLEEYTQLRSDLGTGWVHGDAYPGNTLWDGNWARLGDWDEVAIAPRELDLVNTHQGARMGRSEVERRDFAEAYGWDVTAWSGYPTLRAMRDLHTLGAYIDRAECGDAAADRELQHRIRTLRAGDTAALWHSA